MAEVEDVIYMFTLLNVNKIVLPKFVALDLDCIRVVAGSQAAQSVQSNVTKLTDTVEQLISRMERMEMNDASRAAVRISSIDGGYSSTVGGIYSNQQLQQHHQQRLLQNRPINHLPTWPRISQLQNQYLALVSLQLQADDNRIVQSR